MKIIVAHHSPDMDAITSIWLIKRFVPGWEEAVLRFVPAGSRIENSKEQIVNSKNIIEEIGNNQVIHVDTGLGPLDHHQTSDMNTCAASLTFDYVKSLENNTLTPNAHKAESVKRIVDYVTDLDHFQEVYYENPTSDRHDMSIDSIRDGYITQHPGDDIQVSIFVMGLLDAALHELEAKIWGEEEIKEKGVEFTSPWGKALGVETINDDVLKLGQKMGYVVTVRKDPKSGNVRIKARPNKRVRTTTNSSQLTDNTSQNVISNKSEVSSFNQIDVDFTAVYEKLKEMDPEANWYLHVSKRMLLNGSGKNTDMKPSKLTLDQVIEVLKNQ